MPRYHNVNGNMVQFSADEETARDAEEAAWAAGANTRAAASVREDRDKRLAECDWMANSDVTMASAWKTYRQGLRDVPAQSGFPENISWPPKPV